MVQIYIYKEIVLCVYEIAGIVLTILEYLRIVIGLLIILIGYILYMCNSYKDVNNRWLLYYVVADLMC